MFRDFWEKVLEASFFTTTKHEGKKNTLFNINTFMSF